MPDNMRADAQLFREDARPHAHRAQQFMPFAALKGFYDLVQQQECVTEPRHEPTEEELLQMSQVIARLDKGMMVRVRHYDERCYRTTEGVISRLDTTFHTLTIVKRTIAFEDMRSIEIVQP